MNLTVEEARFFYRARFLTNYDGDTVDVELDMGFRHIWSMRLRLYGINAPELRTTTLEAGKLSRDFIRSLLINRHFYVRTYKDEADKYGGRWLAEIFAPISFVTPSDFKTAYFDEKGTLTNINQLMIDAGFAVAYTP